MINVDANRKEFYKWFDKLLPEIDGADKLK